MTSLKEEALPSAWRGRCTSGRARTHRRALRLPERDSARELPAVSGRPHLLGQGVRPSETASASRARCPPIVGGTRPGAACSTTVHRGPTPDRRVPPSRALDSPAHALLRAAAAGSRTPPGQGVASVAAEVGLAVRAPHSRSSNVGLSVSLNCSGGIAGARRDGAAPHASSLTAIESGVRPRSRSTRISASSTTIGALPSHTYSWHRMDELRARNRTSRLCHCSSTSNSRWSPRPPHGLPAWQSPTATVPGRSARARSLATYKDLRRTPGRTRYARTLHG